MRKMPSFKIHFLPKYFNICIHVLAVITPTIYVYFVTLCLCKIYRINNHDKGLLIYYNDVYSQNKVKINLFCIRVSTFVGIMPIIYKLL